MKSQKKFYTAKYDIIFKAVMVHNENILRKLLEVILKIDIDEIILLDKEISPSHFKGKTRILDMLVKSNNKVINVELNGNKEEWHNYRNASYIFAKYNDGVNKENDYKKIMEKEYIGINLSYEIKESKNIYEEYKLMNKEEKEFIKNLKIIEIDMDKIEKDWYTLDREEKEEYKYLRMLNMEEKQLTDFCRGDTIMEEYENEVKEVNKNEEYKHFLTDEEDAEMCRRTELHVAYDKGIDQGIDKAKKEMIKSFSDLLSPEQISEKTNISIEEVNKIINS